LCTGEDDSKDELGVESSMKYLGSELKVDLENAELLVTFEILQVQTVGEIKRSGYVDGWKATGQVIRATRSSCRHGRHGGRRRSARR
jgi:DCN1-like protein 1/2